MHYKMANARGPDPHVFAQEWITAWNAHDLDRILAHYSEEVQFLSPNAIPLTGHGEVNGKAALRAYWGQALAKVPHLHFSDPVVFVGFQTVTILYHRHDGKRGAETMIFGANGLISCATACYA